MAPRVPRATRVRTRSIPDLPDIRVPQQETPRRKHRSPSSRTPLGHDALASRSQPLTRHMMPRRRGVSGNTRRTATTLPDRVTYLRGRGSCFPNSATCLPDTCRHVPGRGGYLPARGSYRLGSSHLPPGSRNLLTRHSQSPPRTRKPLTERRESLPKQSQLHSGSRELPPQHLQTGF